MTSNNNTIFNQVSQNNNPAVSELNKTNNDLKSESNNINPKKKLSKKVIIIIVVSAVLVAAIITLIIVLATKKSKKTSKHTVPSSQNIVETTDIIEEVNTTYYEESSIIIDYEEAEKIIGLEKTKETHELLNNSTSKLEELIQTINIENANLSIFNISIGELPENVDFLKNTSNNTLLLAKQDLDLYMESFSAIPEQINNLTLEMSKAMENISHSLNEYRNDIICMSKQFEQNIRYLAIPLSERTNNLRNLDELDELTKKYKEELDKLINSYNDNVLNQNNIIGGFIGHIKFQYDKKKFIFNLGKDTIIAAGKILFSVTLDILHDKLLELKDLLITYLKY